MNIDNQLIQLVNLSGGSTNISTSQSDSALSDNMHFEKLVNFLSENPEKIEELNNIISFAEESKFDGINKHEEEANKTEELLPLDINNLVNLIVSNHNLPNAAKINDQNIDNKPQISPIIEKNKINLIDLQSSNETLEGTIKLGDLNILDQKLEDFVSGDEELKKYIFNSILSNESKISSNSDELNKENFANNELNNLSQIDKIQDDRIIDIPNLNPIKTSFVSDIKSNIEVVQFAKSQREIQEIITSNKEDLDKNSYLLEKDGQYLRSKNTSNSTEDNIDSIDDKLALKFSKELEGKQNLDVKLDQELSKNEFEEVALANENIEESKGTQESTKEFTIGVNNFGNDQPKLDINHNKFVKQYQVNKENIISPQVNFGEFTHEQIKFSIAKAQAEGSNDIKINLVPAELGSLEVRMTITEHGKADIHIKAEKMETLAMLQRDSGSLEKALIEIGISTDSNSMSFSMKDHNANQNNEQNQQFARYHNKQENESSEINNNYMKVNNYVMDNITRALDIRV